MMSKLADTPISQIVSMSKVRKWWSELPDLAILAIIALLFATITFLLIYYGPDWFNS
jgi:hypothetical protein